MCGLNGFHSRNEMTNLSARTPHPFLWGKRLLDPDRYLPKKQDPLFEKKRVELMSINAQKQSLRSLAGYIEHPQGGGIKGLSYPPSARTCISS